MTREPHVRFLPWVQEWVLHTLTTSFFDCAKKDIEKLAAQAKDLDQIGRRALALVARAKKNDVWVREFRRDWNAMPAWDKRAVIWAGAILSSGEQNAWRKQVEAGDVLDRVVALHALRPPPPPLPKRR